MSISQQKLLKLEVQTLKNLKNLEVDFDGSPITAILGPNGNGKSTILHALACAFEPNDKGENYKFSSFFLPNTDALWDGSAMKVTHSFRDGRNVYENQTREYAKVSDRWTPRYKKRPKRDVFYIGIDKCVPMIESEKKQAKINYSTEELTEEFVEKILEKASIILNKRYTKINRHIASGKEFIGVEADGLRYSALSMSAGEQKIFFILEKVFLAPKYSLILIDELDLLLHDDAMKKLISIIHARAEDRNLQIVFTTHRESVLELSDIVNIRHIISRGDKSLCFNETKPDAIKRLTGQQPKPIEVFVEDDLASKIISKIAGQLRIKKYLSIQRFGAAINCFTIVGGLILSGEDCQNSLFVIDGDVYTTESEKREKICRVITGDDEHAITSRDAALTVISQLVLPEGVKPEKHIHNMICALRYTHNEEFNEIIDAAREIIVVDNSHKYVDDIIERLGWDKSEGLTKIIDLASSSADWEHYINPIKVWLEARAQIVREDLASN